MEPITIILAMAAFTLLATLFIWLLVGHLFPKYRLTFMQVLAILAIAHLVYRVITFDLSL